MRSDRRSTWLRPLAAGLLLAAVALSGSVVLGGALPAASSVISPTPGPPPAVPGPGHAYLGAFVDPSGVGAAPSPGEPLRRALQPELDAVSSLNSALDRPLAILSAYQDWEKPLFDSAIDQILAAGAIPMINWNCGDTDANVAAGADDATVIRPFAEKLASLAAPILLRWFPDPNLATAAGVSHCLGTDGAAGYARAYAHISQVFRSAGATNVGFVWSVDTTAGDGNWTSWFPGVSNVDWIAADGVDCAGPVANQADSVASVRSWYQTFSGTGKPLMISGTQAATTGSVAYVADMAKVVPARFPLIKALVYQDAPRPPGCAGGSAPAVSGTAVLAALSRQAYFQPSRAAATVAVTVPTTSVAVGQVVKLEATVTPPGSTGSVAFLLDGRPLAGCEAVAVRSGAACSTSSLPPGTDSLSARFSGDAVTDASTSGPVDVTVSASLRWTGPPAIPGPGHAYLGAWVQPPGAQAVPAGADRMELELQSLPALNASLGRPLSIVHVFQSWSDPEPNSVLRRVLATGAVPMIDWKCGDSDANVIAGIDDALITGFADQLVALGAPVLLRWFWEPNFDTSSSPTERRCLDPAGQALGPAGYVAAFRHIHDLFTAAGATNVAFVWSVGSEGTDQDMVDYYPGSQYVDWIAVDGYERSVGPTGPPLVDMLRRWYSSFYSFGLPMMISETGAVAAAQRSLLSQIGDKLPSLYPRIKAVVYLDSDPVDGTHGYQLSPDPGLPGFVALSRTSYFQPSRQPSVTTLVESPNPARAAARVVLTAAWPAPDGGGAVSFTADGQAIAGCEDLPPAPTATCRTAAPGVGNHLLAAVFSGDWQFGPSQSAPLVVTVEAAPTTSPATKPGGSGPPAVRGPASPPGVTVPAAPPVPATALPPVDLQPGPDPAFTGLPTVAALVPLPPLPGGSEPTGGGPLESAGGWIRPEPPGSAPTGAGPEPPPSAGSNGPLTSPDPRGTDQVRAGYADWQTSVATSGGRGWSIETYLAIPVSCAEIYLFASWLVEEQSHRRRLQLRLEGIEREGRER